MTDKELIKKLNNLRNLEPDLAWQKSNREILLAQISNSSGDYHLSTWDNFWIVTRNVFATASQPVLIGLGIFVFLGSSLLFGHNFLNVSPDSSLYIAKIISEKAQLNFTFNKDSKTKMENQFASAHAQNIVSTLSGNQNMDSVVTAKLNDNFKNEIKTLKDSLNIKTDAKNDDIVYSADSGKDNIGLTVYNPNVKVTDNKVATDTKTIVAPKVNTTTPAVVKTEKPDATQILNDAEKMFADKNYSGALDKLKEVDEIIK
jgi:hypothetical protein